MTEQEVLEYELTVRDYITANRAHFFHGAQGWFLMAIGVILVLMSGAGLLLQPRDPVLLFGLVFGVPAAFYPFTIMPYTTRRLYRMQRQMHGPVKAILDETQVTYESRLIDTTCRWLYRVLATKRVLMLYNTPKTYILVPRRVCRDAAQYERIEQLARGLVKK